VDATLLRLADPAVLKDLVFPADDAGHTRIRALFAEVLALPYAAVHDVLAVDVSNVECEVPLFPVRVVTGNWTQTLPANSRTEVQYEAVDGAALCWVEVTAELSVTAVLAIDPGDVESVQFSDLGAFATLDEFRAKFRYFDLDAFMAEHGLHTVEDLRRAFAYLRGEVKLRPVATFDPQDPANQRRYRFRLAVLVRDQVDVAAALRDVRTVLAAAERTVPYRRDVDDAAEARAPWAPLLVFSAAGVPPGGPTQDQLTQFFASQRVLAIFQTP
jgi:hypothetical protein